MGRVEGQIKLSRYLPHAVIATGVVAVAPLWFSLWLTDGSTIASLVISIGLSVFLSSIGAALWKRTKSSYDLVFDDLMLWGYLRRLRAQRQVPKSIERIKLAISNDSTNALSSDDRLRLLKRLAVSLETGDPYTNGHSLRVAHHAFMTARAMRLPRRTRNKIRLAALMHDVGKLFVAKEVLNKPGKLNDDEFTIIKSHPSVGAEMIERIGDDELTEMVRHHHERMDGTGYPDRLSGTEIPIGARIIAVADTFDAITSRRAYRPAQKHKVALEIIEREAGTQLDAEVVTAFLSYYSGRKSLRRWLFFTTGFRQTLEFSLVALQRAGAAAANAAVVGGATVALAGTGAFQADVPKPVHHRHEVARPDDSHKKAKSVEVATEDDSSVSEGFSTSGGSSGESAPAQARSQSSTVDRPGKSETRANDRSAVAAEDPVASKARGTGPKDEDATVANAAAEVAKGSGKPAAPPGQAAGGVKPDGPDEPSAADLIDESVSTQSSNGKGKTR